MIYIIQHNLVQYVTPVMISNWETQESKIELAPYAGSYNYPNANAQSDMGMKNKRNKTSKGEKIAGSKFN